MEMLGALPHHRQRVDSTSGPLVSAFSPIGFGSFGFCSLQKYDAALLVRYREDSLKRSGKIEVQFWQSCCVRPFKSATATTGTIGYITEVYYSQVKLDPFQIILDASSQKLHKKCTTWFGKCSVWRENCIYRLLPGDRWRLIDLYDLPLRTINRHIEARYAIRYHCSQLKHWDAVLCGSD